MATRLILLLTLTSLLSTPTISAAPEDDENLSFLEEPESDDVASHRYHQSDTGYSDKEDEDLKNYDDFKVFSHQDEEEDEVVKFDEKDVVVLTDGNFSDFVDDSKYVMVEFYAPWCRWSKALAPVFAAAATELKAENVKLAKVDATEENELAKRYKVQGYPTLYFFVDGEHKPYYGRRTKDAIVTWIKKKTGPGVSSLTTTEDAERVLSFENQIVLGFIDTLVGPDSEELAAASKLHDDDVNFYQTTDPNVAKMFYLKSDVKRPALVLLADKVTRFDGDFKRSAISEFVSANKRADCGTLLQSALPEKLINNRSKCRCSIVSFHT